MPFKILHIIDNLNLGGTQRALIHLVQGLSARGYSQDIYCLNGDVHAGTVASLKSCGAGVHVVGKWRLASLVGIAQLWRAMKAGRPDIVQTFLHYSDIIGRTLAHAAHVPVVVTSIRARNAYKSHCHFWLDRKTMGWAHRVVFNSRHTMPFSMEHEGVKPEQVVVICNGVDETRFMRGKKKQPGSPLVIGTVGRLNPQKGFGDLLEAFAVVLAAKPETCLMIVGDGPLRHALRDLAAQLGIGGRVDFLGDRPDVPTLMASMDAFVLPSHYEGMPNVIMEAMAAGLPIVATGVDGTLELIEDNKTGWLVPPKAPRELARKILYVLEHPEEAAAAGEKARHAARTQFSLERMVDSYDVLYKGLMAKVSG